ncbi:MAG: hypothetical protein ACLSH5_03385 [Christensenellales bacterium]
MGDVGQYLVIAVQRHGRSDSTSAPIAMLAAWAAFTAGLSQRSALVSTTTGREPLSHATDK